MKRTDITPGRIIGMALTLILILAMPLGAMAQQNKHYWRICTKYCSNII